MLLSIVIDYDREFLGSQGFLFLQDWEYSLTKPPPFPYKSFRDFEFFGEDLHVLLTSELGSTVVGDTGSDSPCGREPVHIERGQVFES